MLRQAQLVQTDEVTLGRSYHTLSHEGCCLNGNTARSVSPHEDMQLSSFCTVCLSYYYLEVLRGLQTIDILVRIPLASTTYFMQVNADTKST